MFDQSSIEYNSSGRHPLPIDCQRYNGNVCTSKRSKKSKQQSKINVQRTMMSLVKQNKSKEIDIPDPVPEIGSQQVK